MYPLYKNEEITILVVDDNTRNIQVIGQMLVSSGYKVSFATGGAEALEILKAENEFDLVLLDILMPGMDGFEVCRKMKENEISAGIPIIFLTAKSDKESVVKGLEMGANDYVIKPFNDDELLLRVKTQIDLLKQREKLEQVNQTLEQKVAEKTAEITKANQKLSLLEKAKSDFLTLISHELRTPLNIINGFTEILQNALQKTEHTEDINTLRDSTDRLVSLADTALLITEIQLGKYLLDFNSVNLDEICNEVPKEIRINYPDKPFAFRIESGDKPAFVLGDRDLISNIVQKITENSIVACEENCEISYRLRNVNGSILLDIIDNGPGFSKEDLEKLFELFSKNGPDYKRGGFGLGLAAVKLVMELHSGSVTAENLPEGGARVTLAFKPIKANPKK